MNYCFDFIETPIIKLFVLDSSEGVHFLIKDNDKSIKNILNLYNPTKGLKLKKAKILINTLRLLKSLLKKVLLMNVIVLKKK